LSPTTLLIALVVVTVPIALLLLRVYRPTRPTPRGAQTLPNVVHKGFHDHRNSGDLGLAFGAAPEPGQAVKVKISLREGLTSPAGDSVEWFAMAGRITQVRSETQVSVDLVASGDAYPRCFRGSWRGVLERRDEMQFPWVLSELRPIG
jgi:hypothetical protein